jgi:hypothetical protein
MRNKTHARRYTERVMVDGRWVHPDAPHDTCGGYTNWGCRCVPCTVAFTEEQARIRANRYAARVLVDGRLMAQGVAHGKASSYNNHGCRCVPCTDSR